MPDRFVAVARRNGDAGVIDITGELDSAASAPLAAAYGEAATSAQRITLNFSELTYMNSSGIALIVELLGRARAAGLSVHAFGLSEHYRQIFEITRLADFVEIHADEPSAVA
jgi:anti-sigma B factor antagonist